MAHPSDAGGRGTRESRSLAPPWSFPIDAHEFRLSVGVQPCPLAGARTGARAVNVLQIDSVETVSKVVDAVRSPDGSNPSPSFPITPRSRAAPSPSPASEATWPSSSSCFASGEAPSSTSARRTPGDRLRGCRSGSRDGAGGGSASPFERKRKKRTSKLRRPRDKAAGEGRRSEGRPSLRERARDRAPDSRW
jgi:hypothetical protein